MTNRLFVSFDIPDIIKHEIISIRDSIYEYSDKVRWEGEAKLHFTFKFLGDVDDSLNGQIISLLNEIVLKHKKNHCEFERFGFFYRGKDPRILWIGLRENGPLTELHHDIESELNKLGFEKEKRRFNPHLTLLRIKGREDKEKLKKFINYQLPKIEFEGEKISLIKSVLKQTGSIYTTIQSFYLI